jgi:hypothetical protein
MRLKRSNFGRVSIFVGLLSSVVLWTAPTWATSTALTQLISDHKCSSVLGRRVHWSSTQMQTLVNHVDELNLVSWSERPEVDPLTTQIILKVIEFTPQERQSALALLARSGKQSEELKLALFDRKAWLKRIDDFMAEGDEGGTLSRAFAPILEQMPQDLRVALLAKVRTLYLDARKNTDLGDEKGRQIINAPKRALDILVNSLLPPKKIIGQLVQSGMTPFQAYGEWLKQIQDAMGFNSYDAYAVDKVLTTIQNFLRQEISIGRAKHSDTLTLFGSFPQGRAKKESSDIDLNGGNSAFENSDLENLKETINHEFRVEKISIQLSEATFHLVDSSESNDEDSNLSWTNLKAAEASPVQFEIHENKIVMQIYPSVHGGGRYTRADRGVVPDAYPFVIK